MTLALGSLFADLRALQHRGAALWLWKTAALTALAPAATYRWVERPALRRKAQPSERTLWRDGR
jgi:hypothetical protein